MVQVPFSGRNLRHRSNAEGRFAVQVQPLFWNLHRLLLNLYRPSVNLRRLSVNRRILYNN